MALGDDLDFIRNNDPDFSGSDDDVKRLIGCLTCIGASETTWDSFCQTIASGFISKKHS
jgi:hypothetical protein